MDLLQSRTVFLADDDTDDCLLFEDALRVLSSSVELTVASDGVELMRVLDERVPPPPDVIFLDLNMPKKNGVECLREIKRIPRFKNIPVVIFSTSAQPEAIDEVYEEGANYFIRKPGSFSQLTMAIREVITKDWRHLPPQPSREKFLLSF